MLETKAQKSYLVTAVVLIVVLSLVSFWNRSSFRYEDATDYTRPSLTQQQAEAYLNYLETLEVDPAASQLLFEEILTEEDIRKEVEEDFQINQPVVVPIIEASSLNISEASGKGAVEEYLSEIVTKTMDFNRNNDSLNNQLFAGNRQSAETIKDAYVRLLSQYLGVETPEEALKMQQALVSAYTTYGELLETNKEYAVGDNPEPWPEVYHDSIAIANQVRVFDNELENLTGKYQISQVVVKKYYAENGEELKVPLVKTAHAAIFGGLSVTIGDIPRILRQALEDGLLAAYSTFMQTFLADLLNKIESNYMIANFLYYTDALVAGQYADDYMQKYVTDTFDQQIIRSFIPQFSCGAGTAALRPVFEAKAAENLGFDPALLSPTDPNFYQKLARVGNFLSTPEGWELHYSDIASQVQSEAEKAAGRELVSPGLKTARDSVKQQITSSLNGLASAQKASLQAIFDLGNFNAEEFISSVVSGFVQTVITNFVFSGVSSAGDAAIGVLKEQSTCLAAAQLNIILPTSPVGYTNPPPPPDENELIRQACERAPRGCEGIYGSYVECLTQTGDVNGCCNQFPSEPTCQ